MTNSAYSISQEEWIELNVRLRMLEKHVDRLSEMITKADLAVVMAKEAMSKVESMGGAVQGDPTGFDDAFYNEAGIFGGLPPQLQETKAMRESEYTPPRTEMLVKDVPSGTLDELQKKFEDKAKNMSEEISDDII